MIGEDVQLGSLPVTPMLTLSDRLPLANAGRPLARPPSLMFSGSRSCTLLSCSWGYLHQRPWQPTCRDSSLSERKQPIFPCRHDVGSRMDAWHRDQLLTASSVKHKVASRQLSTAGRLRVIRIPTGNHFSFIARIMPPHIPPPAIPPATDILPFRCLFSIACFFSLNFFASSRHRPGLFDSDTFTLG